MRISYRWLERHIDLAGVPPTAVADLLNRHVAEIEAVEPFAPALTDVVVGRVLERSPHPNADRLSLCRVDAGGGEPLGIVCGAPNVAAGQTVAVATVGTRLPGDFEIKRARIRGVDSEGMICSERELGLGDEHAGIWVLPDGAAPGTPVADAFGGPDWVLVLDNKAVTHRPDLWGHRGLAVELGVLLDRPLRPLDTTMPEPASPGAALFPVRIDTPRCRRLVAVSLEGVRVERSPEWLRLLLLAAGQRPLDLLVDVSNFVMLDLGQPNHLFDRRQVKDGLEVREARAGEVIRTLDGQDRALVEGDLLIGSGGRPVALAGIMGGEASKVAPDSRSLVLEVANFDAATLRRTSSRLGLRSEASTRFEKALDPALPPAAAAHLVRTLQAIQPGAVLATPPTDAGAGALAPTVIRLRPARVRALLGIAMDDDAMARVLERLRFSVDRADGAAWRVTVPSDRATKDIAIEEDLVEEIGRIHGYEGIPEAPLIAELTPVVPDRRQALIARAEDVLAGAPAFHQLLSYSFVDERLVEQLGLAGEPYSRVVNAVAAGQERLRRSVAPSLLGALARNLRLEPDLRLFEIGKGSRPETVDDRGKPGEVEELALVWALAHRADGFLARAQDRLKGVLEALLADLGLAVDAWRVAEAGERPAWSHPGRAQVGLSGGALLVTLADLDPAAARRLDLQPEADVAVATVHLDAAYALPPARPSFRAVPRFPGVKLDVAVAAPAALPAAALEAAIRRAGGGLLDRVELFDLYSGGQVGDRRSLAYHLLLQAPDRTLSDDEGQAFLDRLEAELTGLGAELRRA